MPPARRSRLPSRIAPDGGRNEDEGTKQRLHGKSNAGELRGLVKSGEGGCK